MEITINNSNNIIEGKVTIIKNKLNLKYGINGTGKSTISKAIRYKIESPAKLCELTPFRLQNNNQNITPEVTFNDEIQSVLIFNEDYLNQFLFKENELIANSYEIFIHTPEFRELEISINNSLSDVNDIFAESEQLNEIIFDFEKLLNSFTTTQTGLSKTSAIYKGLREGNKVKHIPESLKGYSKLIKNSKCINWLDWQNKGEEFLNISDDCPYCTSPTTENKEVIKSVASHYDKNVIKNFNIIIETIKHLGDYFSDAANKSLIEITEKQNGIETSEMNFIAAIKQQISALLYKLKQLKNLSPVSFSEDDQVAEKLKGLKINIQIFDRFDSQKTNDIINSLNESLDAVLKEVGILKGEISKQKRLVKSLIEKHKKSINEFLKNAGYKYIVEIETDPTSSYRLILKHIESKKEITGGQQHLSFGEKNAFALVLFMYEAIHKKPDLVILDDPISSFDRSKKYAIMHMLFRGIRNNCLIDKTVLMLTHDLEPIIDTIKVLKKLSNQCNAHYISTLNGILTEKEIKKSNLMSFGQICTNAINSDLDDIIKVIYLRRRFEIMNEQQNEYQVLSNLLHGRTKEECTDFRKPRENNKLSNDDFNDGVEKIEALLPKFRYERLLENIKDKKYLVGIYKSSKNGYCRLNIFRLLFNDKESVEIPDVLRKYINESYHIENELICQLDPNEYDIIPGFIIEECDKYVEEQIRN